MYKTITAQIGQEFSTQVLLGEEFLVVPVVAMIEGVRFGANQNGNGELGLVEEFGKFPEGWNNRPVVMNHPQIDGNFVSANSPKVLDQFSLGTTMHTQLIGNKLKMQAWLSKTQNEGSEARLDMIQRIEAGETVEVSVGFFTEVREESGTFDGVDFTGIWTNIVPDHLAFLSKGTIGACSISDGCGANREGIIANVSNITNIANLSSIKNQGVHMTNKIFKFLTGNKGQEVSKISTNCGDCTSCPNKPATLTSTINNSTTEINTDEDKATPVMLSQKEISALKHFLVQAIPEGIISSDITRSLELAIGDQHDWSFVLGFTSTHVIFETWSVSKDRWVILQQAFSMDADGKTTFSSNPEEINLLTRIVPVTNNISAGDININQSIEEDVMPNEKAEDSNDITVNAADDVKEVISTDNTSTPAPKVNEAVNTESFGNANAPVVNSALEVVVQEKPTVQEYIANAPIEVQEILKESLATHESAKGALIKGIQDTGRSVFSDDYLQTQSLDTLRGLSKLSNVPNYLGKDIPTPTVQSVGSGVPEAPRLGTKT